MRIRSDSAKSLLAVLAFAATAAAGAPEPVAAPGIAAADDQRGAAREAFAEALALARTQRYGEALTQFRASERIRSHPVTSYNIAFCEGELGMPASAYRDYVHALTSASAAGTAGLPAEYVDAARRRADEAAARVARVKVSRPNADSVLRVDGHAVELVVDGARSAYVVSLAEPPQETVPAALELWLDPGEHVFVALSRSGATLFEQRRVLESGGSTDVVMPPPLPVSVATPAPPPERIAPPGAGHHPPERDGVSAAPDRTWAYVALGTSAAALVTGGVFGVLTLNDKAYLDEGRCPNQMCPSQFYSREDRMERFAAYATAGLVVGLAAGAAGAYLWFTATPAHPAKATTARVVPRVGLGRVDLVGAF
jgi:hypothetical protein